MNDITPIPETTSYPVSALVTTGIVSAITAFSAALLWFHFFPQQSEIPTQKIAVVDLIKLSASISKMNAQGGEQANQANVNNAIAAVERLKEEGYLVLDARGVISAPAELFREPSQLVLGAPDYIGSSANPTRK